MTDANDEPPGRPPIDAPGELTHFDAEGRAHMVDVGDKAETHRVAVAEGCIRMRPETLAMIEAGTHRKGDVLGIARVAGIMGAKRTSDLVPLCHPIGLTRVAVDFTTEHAGARTADGPDASSPTGADAGGAGDLVRCRVRAETRSRTGVEMEALIGLQVALATVYDMCKAVDRGMTMSDIRVLEKRGGKSGDWRVPDA